MNIQAPITHVDYELSNNTATNCNMFENTEVQDICFTNQQVLQQIRILYTSNRLKLLYIIPRVLPSLIPINQLITSFQVLEVFTLVGQTLKKELIQFLDRVANDVYMTSTLPRFPYKSFGESIHLVMISMMRELLSSKKGWFNIP